MSFSENHPKVAALLKAEQALAATCYSITWLDGLKEGISLRLDQTHGPHLVVGNEVLKRSNTIGCLYQPFGNGTVLVRRAQLDRIEPYNGKPFCAFERIRDGGKEEVLAHVSWGSVASQKDKKIKAKHQDLNLYGGLVTVTASLIASGHTEAFLRFTRDGQFAEICQPNGLVQKILFQKGKLTEVTLKAEEMASVRLLQAKAALVGASKDRVRHGIIGGVIRLLSITATSPKAREVILGFLSEQDLIPPMRRNIQGILDGFRDPRAVEFAPEIEGAVIQRSANVVDISAARKKSQGHFSTIEKSQEDREAARRKRHKNLAERRERDRERTAKEHARGGGQKEPEAAGGKKGR